MIASEARPHNLPRQLSSFLARGQELLDFTAALDTTRLLTLARRPPPVGSRPVAWCRSAWRSRRWWRRRWRCWPRSLWIPLWGGYSDTTPTHGGAEQAALHPDIVYVAVSRHQARAHQSRSGLMQLPCAGYAAITHV